MTTIKSVFEHSPATLLVESGKHEGEVYFRTNHGSQPYGDAIVSRAEVINALGAVDKVELANTKSELELTRSQYVEAVDVIGSWKARAEAAEAKLAGIDEMGCGCDEADENLRKVQAERDELAATIERVREIAENSYNSSWLALKGIRDALDPKPAFVLLTEAGARFEATDNLGHEVTFRAVWNGPHIMYLNESTSVIWNRDNLLAGCTDFRLLGGAE